MCFFNVCKIFCTHLHNFSEIVRGACRLRSAIENTSCSHRLLLPSELSRQTSRRYGVPFLCASRTPLQKLCRRVRRLRSRLPLASNFSLFTCRHQLYGLFCHRRLSAAVLFVWFFNLKYRGFSFNTSSLWLFRSVFDDKHRERRVVRPIIKIKFQDLIFRRIERFQIWQQRVSFLVARVAAVINAHAH